MPQLPLRNARSAAMLLDRHKRTTSERAERGAQVARLMVVLGPLMLGQYLATEPLGRRVVEGAR